ncbi:MAG: multidrug efflux RND transporter permease subunit [Nitrosomonas sp.]|nr:multidrug efflux RND transporter permease subunit [Nitrosomonas sp.]MCP5252172.1 multidrug efflux RND transporter permease subunit [Burkholderiales bacterium]MCP5292487.1 multidrug efflux RND transporter permease subunit [Burkholderiales bacterium]MDR4520445.1 multidrug efflux RND transporter permease subunit [Nitrosomonas sp.]
MTKFFITRPIFASVLSIIIVLAGIAAAFQLPIAQYPQITPPVVQITARFPGASAETLIKTVAAPIEEQLSGVDDLLYFNSSADSSGQLTITVTFEIGVDIDLATFNISNRVNIALPRLPDEVRRSGITIQKRANDLLLVFAITSQNKDHTPLFLSNYITNNFLDDLKRSRGVGEARIFGAQDYSMRIWLQPDKMAQLGITTSDIATAIRAQNAQYAAGKIGQDPALPDQQLVYTVTAKGRLTESEEFGNIILRADGPRGVLYLKDVARIELGAQEYNIVNMLNGVPGVGIGIFLQTGANALDTAAEIKSKMEELRPLFPEGMQYVMPYDTSQFVKASIWEVVKTLGEAMILVVLVVYLFLQTWRATLIPIIAVPISLIGTFAGLWLLGYSINTMTLFAMVLSIGIVVDDAIVVLENIERLMTEEKLSPLNAAIKAMQQVSSAVVAMTLVLAAVFVPVAFLGGMAGELYRQFAVTVAVAGVISGVVALTLTPALCALLLQSAHQHAAFFEWFNRIFNRVRNFYVGRVNAAIHHVGVSILIFAAFIAGVGYLLKIIPGSLVPPEDQGYVIAAVILPDSASLSRTTATADAVRIEVEKNEDVAFQFAVNGLDFIGGGNKTNVSTMFTRMTEWSERESTADDLVGQVFAAGAQQKDGMAVAFNPPAIRGLGSTGGFELYVQSRTSSDPQRLAKVVDDFMAALMQDPMIASINAFYRTRVPQFYVHVDEAKAISQGIAITDIYETLQSTMGSLYVNDFNRAGRTYRVQLQADAAFRMKPEDIGKVYVRSRAGQMVPLSALIRIEHVIGAEQLERFNGLLSAKLIGSGVAGLSSGEAIALVERIAEQVLPDGYQIAWTGKAFQEKRTGAAAVFAFSLAIIMVFLILAAQFETWALPLAVIMAVPFAMAGALLAVLLRDMPNDIYFQIGMVTLIGLAAKNAILLVEFANQKMKTGMDVTRAALESAQLRFRPIVMTSMAFILGVVPLVIATGAGSAARQSMGTGVFGGMILAAFVSTVFVPLFFSWFVAGKKASRSAMRWKESASIMAAPLHKPLKNDKFNG